MNKNTTFRSCLAMLFGLFLFLAPTIHTSAQLADGSYSVPYSVIKPDSGSASMADGYFAKPAKVTVKNGQTLVELTTTSSMIKEFQVESAGSLKNVTTVSQNGENETVQFAVDSISSPVNAKIHVLADASYDHWYSIRLSFNEGSMKVIETAQTNNDSKSKDKDDAAAVSGNSEGGNSANGTVPNPETGDTTNLYILLALLIGSSAVLIRKITVKRG
ncbi:NEAT domain-containing protein [Cytobacillus horneckiae]|uniref:NEAT domain-containing protein n=1 Tax=Cytobacillus horneckiae TaxID=549687 RepID=UPI003D1D5FDE